MSSYAEAALLATELVISGKSESPVEAWAMAVQTVFPNSVAMQQMACPRGAYLGLCEEGLVKGIPRGDYTRAVKNKAYAVDACRLLKKNPSLAATPDRLWIEVLHGFWMRDNQQMAVVVALWSAELIKK